MNAKDAWLATLGQLQIQLNRSTYDTWLRHAEFLGYEDGRFVITVPHAYAKDWIERHLLASMTRTLGDIFQHACEIQVIVWDPVDDEAPDAPLLEYADSVPNTSIASGGVAGILNPAYTFESFVIGQSNRYAVLLANAIVDSPIGKYSPVLFYGDMGMGKTHLLQAITRRLADKGHQVAYLTVEDFMTEMVEAIRTKDNLTFRNKFRTADVVLLDDLQFVEGKTGTQNEIVAVWDALRNRQKTIIFASDRLPCNMVKVSKDARSRFQAGPIASLEPPDLQLRMDILDAKSSGRGMQIPDDVRTLIASRIQTSARDLESAVDQLHTYAQLTGAPVTQAAARAVLKTLGSSAHQEAVPLSAVLEATSRYYGLSVVDLSSRQRTKVIAQARQLAMYLAREETDASLPQIGQALGGRDHSTVVHGCARIKSILATDTALAQDMTNIRQMLHRDNPVSATESKSPRQADAAAVADKLIRQVVRGLRERE